MATLERTYTIPLRREYLKVPKYKRAKKAMIGLRKFLVKHMKSENVRIGPQLNEKVWSRGMKSPPPYVKVFVTKDDDGAVYAELEGTTSKKTKEVPTKGKKEAGEKPTQKETKKESAPVIDAEIVKDEATEPAKKVKSEKTSSPQSSKPTKTPKSAPATKKTEKTPTPASAGTPTKKP